MKSTVILILTALVPVFFAAPASADKADFVAALQADGSTVAPSGKVVDPTKFIYDGIVACKIMGGSGGGAYTAAVGLQSANTWMTPRETYQFCLDAAKYLCLSLTPQDLASAPA